MTLATLIVNVEANTSKLITGVDATNTKLDSMMSTAGKVAGALGIAFSAHAVIGFTNALINDADALVKLHDKTAITLQDLQRMQIAGDDAGVSIDSMANAVNKLQKNLGSESEGATKALKALHLDLRDIRALTPEEQFYEIAAALAKVKDPAEQVALAVALFGKNGAELLPVIKRGFEDVRKAAVGMSDDTIRNLDAVGDAMSRMWRTAKAVFANVLVNAVHPDLFGMRGAKIAIDAARVAAEKMAPVLPTLAPYEVAVNVREIEQALDAERKRLDEVQKGATKAAEQHQRFKDELDRNTDAARKNEAGLAGLQDTVGLLNTTELDSVKASIAATAAFKQLELQVYAIEKSAQIAAFGFKGMADGLEHVGTKSTELDDIAKHLKLAGEEAKTTGATIRTNLAGALEAIPGILTNAFTGGGGIIGALKAIATQIINAIVQPMLSGLVQAAQAATGLSKSVDGVGSSAKAAGAAGSSMLAVYASAALVGWHIVKSWKDTRAAIRDNEAAITDYLKTLASLATAEQVVAANGDQYRLILSVIEQTYLSTGRTVEQARADTMELWKSIMLGAGAAQRAIEQMDAAFQDAFEDQLKDAQDLEAAIQKYGFAIEELGPKLQRQKLSEQAVTLMNDFRLLAGAGIEVDIVLGRMGSSINAFVLTALRTGTEVPSSMQPMLQKMIELGTLTDENGVAFTDLGSTGLTFSETMTQGFDRIVKKFDELLTKIGLITGAVNKIPTYKEVRVVGVYVPPVIGEETAPGVGARSSAGFGSRFGGTPIVVSSRSGGASRPGTDLTGATLDTLNAIKRQLADQGRQIALAVRTAQQLSPRRAA